MKIFIKRYCFDVTTDSKWLVSHRLKWKSKYQRHEFTEWIVDKHMPIELYRNKHKLYNVWTYTASGTHSDTRVCVIQEIIKEIPRHYCYMRGWVQGIYANTANTHRIRSWPANRGKYDASFMFSANYSTSYQLHIGRGFASRWVFTKRLFLLNQLRIKARISNMIISM